MRKILLPIFILISLITKSQSQIGMHGSFVIVAKGKDGIMVASDSRVVLYFIADSNRTPLAYLDGVQKCYFLGSSLIASTGMGMFGIEIENSIMQRFNKDKGKVAASKVLTEYDNWFKRNYNAIEYDKLKHHTLISVGYIGSTASMCVRKRIGDPPQVMCKDTGVIQTGNSLFRTVYSDTISCTQLGDLAEAAILKFARLNNREGSIGGPIRIAHVTPDDVCWIKNPPTKSWTTMKDIIRDYLQGGLTITFSSKESESLLLSIFRKDYPELFK